MEEIFSLEKKKQVYCVKENVTLQKSPNFCGQL